MNDSGAAGKSAEAGALGQSVALSFRFLFLLAGLIAAAWSVSNIRQIPADSQAVVMRLGQVSGVHGPGLLVAWPRPLEEIRVLPSSARQVALRVRRFEQSGGTIDAPASSYELSPDARGNAGFLLTGDGGVVHLQAQLFYQISDPAGYAIAAPHVEPALERMFIASAVRVAASRSLDAILVARPEIASRAAEAEQRERLRASLVQAVNERLRDLAAKGASLGVSVSRVDLVPAIPAGAKEAFDSVLVVTQSGETAVADARTQAQWLSQEANQSRDRIKTQATAVADEVITSARTQTAPVVALAEQARDRSRSMQLMQLYYEHMAGVLKKAGRVDVATRDGALRTIVPAVSP
jgi:regulator of protease activity HflC (stomatin/prohibitin superfamily)